MKKVKLKKGTESVDDLLLAALGSEVIAREFYIDAAQRAKSTAGRTLFNELAGMEQGHYENVKRIIAARGAASETDAVAFKPGKSLPVIKGEIEGEFEANKDEVAEILNRGMEAENKARERYVKIAALLTIPDEKKIFENLAEDERRHHDLLEMEYYQISNKGTIIWGE